MPQTYPPYTIDNLIDYLSFADADAKVNLHAILNHFDIDHWHQPIALTDHYALSLKAIFDPMASINGPKMLSKLDHAMHTAVTMHDYQDLQRLTKFVIDNQFTINELFITNDVPKPVTNGILWDKLSQKFG